MLVYTRRGKSRRMYTGVYTCDKESTVLYCDCVNLRNLMELFRKQVLGNRGWSGIKQDICVLFWVGNHVLLWAHEKAVRPVRVMHREGRKWTWGRVKQNDKTNYMYIKTVSMKKTKSWKASVKNWACGWQGESSSGPSECLTIEVWYFLFFYFILLASPWQLHNWWQ